uniref:EF-hand domain-containing protein n=1 Tax=Peronospora matthiolae TaxID=2874970 RepID=A0AAV1TQ52_9STRA
MSSTALLRASSSSRHPDYVALQSQDSPLSHAIDMDALIPITVASTSEVTAEAAGAYVAASTSSTSVSSKPNPFAYTTPIDTYEAVKMTLLCLLGVPLLRILLLLCAAFLLALVSNVALCGYKRLAPASLGTDPVARYSSPLPHWRRLLGSPVPYLLRLILFIVGFYWIPVKYPPHFDRQRMPRVIVSNHLTFFDGIYLFTLLSPSIAMKADVAKLPLLSRVVQLTKPILIDRGTSEGRKQAMQDITSHVTDPTKPPLLVFPQGTTSNQEALTKFKLGSFVSGLPCQPVAFRYPFQHFDVSWPPGISGLYLAMRVLCQVYNRMEVEILPAYYPSEREQVDPQLYANNVREVMAKALGISTTNHAFEDMAMLMRLGDYDSKHIAPLADVGDVTSLSALKCGNVERLVDYIRQRNLDKDGQLSMKELRALFPKDDPVIVDQLFDLVDADDSGLIDFRELCLALRAVNPHSVDEENDALAKFTFRLYDLDNNGLIDAAEVRQMLRFQRSFYGISDASVNASLHEAALIQAKDGTGITYKRFQQLVEHNPELLGFVRNKLEVLRDSLCGSNSPPVHDHGP